MSLRPGARLGNYEVLSELGSGGMSHVYKAKALKLGREVAIKILQATDPDRLRRFEREASAASALNHPNVVTIHGIGEHQGTPYIAMEYVNGRTLREVLANGPLPKDKLIRYASQLAEGLAKAHQAGIVHRDLKPENVIINSDGLVKILDFGLAKLHPLREGSSDLATLDRQTTPGTVVGTVGYMSPEQAKGEVADSRSDQFSFGAIVYEMATGKRAFERDSAVQTLTAIIEADPEPVTVSIPSAPLHLVEIIDRCLSKTPGDRYESTFEIVREIHRQELVVSAAASSNLRLAPLFAVGLLAIVLVMIVGLFVPDVWNRIAGDDAARVESIAVLPLENLSGDVEEDYFVDGMTEALIAELAKVGELKVISRTSVMRFKGSKRPLPEIANELGVDAVVEGSALRVDDRVRVTAQLIETDSDRHLWAKSYDRSLDDVLSLQRAVAEAIAAEVGALLAREGTSVVKRVSPDAYDAYLKGMYHFHRRAVDDAVAYFEEATRIQPDYALAFVGIAMSHLPSRRVGLADTALERARTIAPDLAESHIPACIVRAQQWRWRMRQENAHWRSSAIQPT